MYKKENDNNQKRGKENGGGERGAVGERVKEKNETEK